MCLQSPRARRRRRTDQDGRSPAVTLSRSGGGEDAMTLPAELPETDVRLREPLDRRRPRRCRLFAGLAVGTVVLLSAGCTVGRPGVGSSPSATLPAATAAPSSGASTRSGTADADGLAEV